MLEETYHRLAARQESYWWHCARRLMSGDLLRRHTRAVRGCRCIDLGCGPGGNLGLLELLDPALIVGVDVSPLALDLARDGRPGAALVRADISRDLPFADNTFDVVTIFNVLYHSWIPSDAAVLAEVRRILRPGGVALFTEPAFQILSRPMDELGMARRRYRLGEFKGLCQSAGLEVVFASYFTSFGATILLALKAGAWLGTWFGARAAPALYSDTKPLRRTLNRALYGTAWLEAQLISRGVRIPLGTTLVCLARRSL